MKQTRQGSSLWFALIFGLCCIAWTLGIRPCGAQEDTLLIIRVAGSAYEQTTAGIRETLDGEMRLVEWIITKQTTGEEITRKMRTTTPQMVVLLDNIAISRYTRYQKTLPASEPVIPTLSLMASFADLAIQGLKNAAAIAYEVPLVTGMVQLRFITSRPFEHVGVVHREFMSDLVARERIFCAKEHVQLISTVIPDRVAPEALKRALEHLRKKEQLDAFWLPNDSGLINAKLLKTVWQPFAKKFEKPIMVGVAPLVDTRLNFGTFAVVPDHFELGVQAADIIFETLDNEWKIETGVVPPLSVMTIMNPTHAARFFHIQEERLEERVDIIAK